MSRSQLTTLFICNLIPYITGNGLLGLLPVYATEHLQTDPAIMGLSMAIGFAMLALSTMMSGWLSKRFQMHKGFIALSAPLSAASTLLMGQAQNIWILTIFLSLSLFMAGIQLTMTNILAGKIAEENQRGRIFGIIGAALALGQLLGGLSAGPIVDEWGFQALFTISALLYGFTLVAALLLKDVSDKTDQAVSKAMPTPINPFVLLLLIASFLAFVANFVTSLGRPLAMSALGFDSTAITTVMAISGAVNLPLPFVLGWLSDRVGRKPVLVACYLMGSAGVGVLVISSAVWHFWISQILISVLGSGLVVSSALVIDLVPSNNLSVSLARLSATPWIGAVFGYAATGVALQNLGMSLTFVIGATLPLIAALLMSAIHSARPSIRLKHATLG